MGNLVETRYNNDVTKLTPFDTYKQAEKWVKNNQYRFEKKLHIGTHIKDGYVAFTYRDHS